MAKANSRQHHLLHQAHILQTPFVIWTKVIPSYNTLNLNTLLSSQESHTAKQFRNHHDHDSYVSAHALKRVLLGKLTTIDPLDLSFTINAHGKPALAESQSKKNLHFNISHTRGMVAIAISRHTPLGVDAEWINSGLDISCVVNENFSPQDLELLASIPQGERKAKSLHLWTLKEAFVKATGKGLTIPLDSFYVSTFDKKSRIVERNTFNQQKWFGFTINPTAEHFLSVVINEQNQMLCEVPFYEISQDSLL